jgi:hypothetical protein
MRLGRKWKTWLGGAAAVLGVLVLCVSYTPGWSVGRRAPTEYETVLYYFAQDIGETVLCDQISWAAYQSYSVLFGGGGSSRWRSDCYEQVAEARHDSSICWNVRPLVDLDPLSSGHSALSCRRNTESGYRSGIALPNDLLIRTFERMGYDIDRMRVEGVMEPAIRMQDVYRSLERNSDALAGARQVLTHADPALGSDDRSLVAHLVAIGTSDPDWCGYIPAGQFVGPVTTAPFRDWCYFTVAVDSQDIRICDRMTPAAKETKVLEAKAAGVRPEIAEQLGLHTECVRSKNSIGPRPHYGPQEPGDDEQTLRIFTALGIAMPSAHDWPAASVAIYYQQFVFALWPSPAANPARDRARADLVRRLIALRRES